MTGKVTKRNLQRTRKTKRGTLKRSDSENSDSDVQQIDWRAMDRYLEVNTDKCGSSTSTATTAPKLVSFWHLIGADREDNPSNILELEAKLELHSPNSVRQIEFDGKAGKD